MRGKERRKRHSDINRRMRSNVEAHGEKGLIIKGAEEGGERMEENSMQRQRTDEENKHPHPACTCPPASCQEISSLVETYRDHKLEIKQNNTLCYKRLPLRLFA